MSCSYVHFLKLCSHIVLVYLIAPVLVWGWVRTLIVFSIIIVARLAALVRLLYTDPIAGP